MARFVYQQSYIWDGSGDRPDPSQKQHKIKTTKGEGAARRKLPQPAIGRRWVLIRVDK